MIAIHLYIPNILYIAIFQIKYCIDIILYKLKTTQCKTTQHLKHFFFVLQNILLQDHYLIVDLLTHSIQMLKSLMFDQFKL